MSRCQVGEREDLRIEEAMAWLDLPANLGDPFEDLA
jgi:hypothetical protein